VNVLNVETVEKELFKFAAHAIHPAACNWVMTVARNYVLGKLSEKDMEMNYRVYTSQRPKGGIHTDMPLLGKLPRWAREALRNGEVLHFFDAVQVCRRPLFQTLDTIVTWFNSWPAEDTRLRRLDRIDFQTAAGGAALWMQDVTTNIWDYVKDKPPIIKSYEDGFHWVRMSTALHFEREGKLMNHCVGNGGYYDRYRKNHAEYYSLRDGNNKPHVTVEVNVTNGRGALVQCKGNSNRKPSPQYQPFIRKFIHNMHWKVEGDQHHIDL
jgi:PcfJ-like protein